MKIFRIGNNVDITWNIVKSTPLSSNLQVYLIDKYNHKQTFDYSINDNVITGTFYGKDQVHSGAYRLLLIENEGLNEQSVVDYLNAFSLSTNLKSSTSVGNDAFDNCDTETIDITSTISTDNLPDDVARIDDIPTKVSQLANDANYTTKDYVDDAVSKIDVDVDLTPYAKKSEVEETYQVKGDYALKTDIPTVPTKVSELENDSKYVTGEDIEIDGISYYVGDDTNHEGYFMNWSRRDGEDGSLKEYTSKSLVTRDFYDERYQDTTKNLFFDEDTGKFTWKDVWGYNTAGDVETPAIATRTYVDEKIETKFDGANYNTENKTIDFLVGDTVKASIDATDFIKDGMVNTVSVVGTNLVISFNTDSGKDDINIPITDLFNADNYYTKTDTDNTFAKKTDIPTKTSQLTNDSNLVTFGNISGAMLSYKVDENTGNASWYEWGDDYGLSTKSSTAIATYVNNKVSSLTWSGTQTEYDALETKSDTTIYMITEE